MSTRFQAFLLASLLGSLPACGPTPPAESKPEPKKETPRYSIEAFMGTTGLFGASFSPDRSKILVSNDISGVYNAHAVPVAGGPSVPLTKSTTNAVRVLGYFPRDERFLYRSDEGGNELHHIYVQAPDGTVTDLTPGENLRADFGGWSQDGTSFFVLTTERDPKFADVYEYATDGYERKLLFKDTVGYAFSEVSPDRKSIAVMKTTTTTDSDMLLVDVKSGKAKNLTKHRGEVRNEPQKFSPDGKYLYFLTNDESEFNYLARYNLATGEIETIEKPAWDVLAARMSKNGRYLAVGINNDARTEMKLFEVDRMKPVQIPQIPGGLITGVRFSDDESAMAFYVDSSRSPSNLYVMDLPSSPPRRLTQSLNPQIDPEQLVDGNVVRFKSTDGVEIPGILYRPKNATPENKVPAIVWVHGGPGGQSRLGYDDMIQFIVNHGYAVYAINNRGSSGYGTTFYKMDDRKHGEGDLDDCVASKTMLADTGWVEPGKIGILGGSYGGYMVLAALAFRPEEFQVGVDLFGVSNWKRTLEAIPPYWESFRQSLYTEMGDPTKDAEMLQKISPLFHAKQIKKPLLVLQGANDPRVLQVESDEMVAAVKGNGVPVEYLIFKDEGHGFVNKKNEAKGNQAILDFLDAHLTGKGATSAEASIPPR